MNNFRAVEIREFSSTRINFIIIIIIRASTESDYTPNVLIGCIHPEPSGTMFGTLIVEGLRNNLTKVEVLPAPLSGQI